MWDSIELAPGQTLDKEKFSTGDHVLATSFYDTGGRRYYEPAEKVCWLRLHMRAPSMSFLFNCS
ncbi:MAG: hypothetical protein GX663_05115 [Clostridiales bacterium]|nr:hypothetical protein [Clostridiales bacterium]